LNTNTQRTRFRNRTLVNSQLNKHAGARKHKARWRSQTQWNDKTAPLVTKKLNTRSEQIRLLDFMCDLNKFKVAPEILGKNSPKIRSP